MEPFCVFWTNLCTKLICIFLLLRRTHLPGDSTLLAKTFFIDWCSELSVFETRFHWIALWRVSSAAEMCCRGTCTSGWHNSPCARVCVFVALPSPELMQSRVLCPTYDRSLLLWVGWISTLQTNYFMLVCEIFGTKMVPKWLFFTKY